MKKIITVFACILLCFSLACNKKLTTYTEIDYEEYIKKLENKETFPLVIGSATCSACGMYKGTMETFIKDYQVEVFYIDLSKIDDESYNKLHVQTSFDGTPTTIFVKDGELTSYYNRIDGSAGLKTVINTFKDNDYID